MSTETMEVVSTQTPSPRPAIRVSAPPTRFQKTDRRTPLVDLEAAVFARSKLTVDVGIQPNSVALAGWLYLPDGNVARATDQTGNYELIHHCEAAFVVIRLTPTGPVVMVRGVKRMLSPPQPRNYQNRGPKWSSRISLETTMAYVMGGSEAAALDPQYDGLRRIAAEWAMSLACVSLLPAHLGQSLDIAGVMFHVDQDTVAPAFDIDAVWSVPPASATVGEVTPDGKTRFVTDAEGFVPHEDAVLYVRPNPAASESYLLGLKEQRTELGTFGWQHYTSGTGEPVLPKMRIGRQTVSMLIGEVARPIPVTKL